MSRKRETQNKVFSVTQYITTNDRNKININLVLTEGLDWKNSGNGTWKMSNGYIQYLKEINTKYGIKELRYVVGLDTRITKKELKNMVK